ncbi:hypothetical protein SAMN04489735_102659, partial [Aneurinibacillus thermoaerophilus]
GKYILVFWLIVSRIQLEIRDFEGLKHTIRGGIVDESDHAAGNFI